MGTDGAWRWRKGVEDKYHYRFWGQVVRWMAYQRNMAKGETMRLFYVPDQPQLRQTLTFDANVMEKSGEPLHNGRVTARITAPSGQSETVRLSSSGEEWGMFNGRYTPEEPGKHQIHLSCVRRRGRRSTRRSSCKAIGRAPGKTGPSRGAGRVGPRDRGQESSQPTSCSKSCNRWRTCPSRRPRSAACRCGAIR